MYRIIFEADTFWGRAFDIGLLVAILASIAVIALETLPAIRENRASDLWFLRAEQFFTFVFAAEYFCRLMCVRRPLRYMLSFWGIVDLLGFLPSVFTGFAFPGPQSAREGSFAIIRAIRLLRVFRILKLWRLTSEANDLANAVWNSRDKIIVFLTVLLVAITISSTLMYHVEYGGIDADHPSQFTSIPQSMYWAVVTMTTVGYGDVVPQTAIGKLISTILILLGYSLIIVPTGFVSAEISGKIMTRGGNKEAHCTECGKEWHDRDANFCDCCGTQLPEAGLHT